MGIFSSNFWSKALGPYLRKKNYDFKKTLFFAQIGILKGTVCKNAKYFMTSSSIAQFMNSRYQQNPEIISSTSITHLYR